MENPIIEITEKTKKECSICHKSIKKKNLTKLNCGHIFHSSCIIEWSKKTTKNIPDCPLCRTKIYKENKNVKAQQNGESAYNDIIQRISTIVNRIEERNNSFTIRRTNLLKNKEITVEKVNMPLRVFLEDINNYFNIEIKNPTIDSISNTKYVYKIYTQDNKIYFGKCRKQNIILRDGSNTVDFNAIRYKSLRFPNDAESIKVFLIKSGENILPIIWSSIRFVDYLYQWNNVNLFKILDLNYLSEIDNLQYLALISEILISKDHKFIYIRRFQEYLKISLNNNKIIIEEKIEFFSD